MNDILPKDKAMQLLESMMEFQRNGGLDWEIEIKKQTELARLSALWLVLEIISAIGNSYCEVCEHPMPDKYWVEVKDELNRL